MNTGMAFECRSAGMQSAEPLLSVRDLIVTLLTDDGPAQATRGVSFDVHEGEILAVVGESGAGKSVTFLAVLGLLQSMIRCEITGQISFVGRDLANASRETLRRIRGRELSMVFQDPLSALNPVLRVGDQIADVLQTHMPGLSRADARRRVIEALELARIPSAAARMRDFPYQFSGGMRQRALIAMAIACRPKLLIADEPTTALDVTVQAQILDLLNSLRRELAMSMVLITHDLGLVARYADRVAVMYAGRIVEESDVATIFAAPAHPYTVGLLDAVPRIQVSALRLASIVGEPPGTHSSIPGCAFEPRCARTQGRSPCRSIVPELAPVGVSHRAACHYSRETGPTIGFVHASRAQRTAIRSASVEASTPRREAVLAVEGLVKRFPIRGGRRGRFVHAVEGVSFAVAAGETLGLVGESGSGKTTTARCVLRLIDADAGRIIFKGQDITKLDHGELRSIRDQMQVVFQDSRAALNPRMTVEAIVAEPLVIRGRWRRDGRSRVRDMLARVGLSARHAQRYPHEFSGGQQQRIGLARALILNPSVIVLDEPISNLDVSIRAQIINLLKDLQGEFGLTYLFIAHDLSAVHHISDRVAVMYLGRIVELGDADAVCRMPLHPYTQMLVASVPEPNPASARVDRPPPIGDAPSQIDPPSGCPFHERCLHAEAVAEAAPSESVSVAGRRVPFVCVNQRPPLVERLHGHWAACHFTE